MKLIIDIDEVLYEHIKVDRFGLFEDAVHEAVINGTPIPKGHGDLIDRDVAYDEFDKACLSWEGGLLKYVPTVIPADR